MTHANNLRTLIWTIFLSIACGTAYTSAQYPDSEAMSWRVVPPQYPEGMEPEIVPNYLHGSTKGKTLSENQEEDNIILYPNKFRVWTTDTNSVYNVLGNRKFITENLKSNNGMYIIDCYVEDAALGLQLRDSLRNMDQVIRADNFAYNPKSGYQRQPTLYLYVSLYEEKDSIRLKNVTDSLGIRVYRDPNPTGIQFWEINIENTKESSTEIAKKLYRTGLCERVINAFATGLMVGI